MALSSKNFWKGFLKGDRSLMGLEPFETKFSEKEFIELGKKLGWKGKGTENDPIIIPNEKSLPQTFSIIGMRLHLKIFDSRFEHIILYNCQYISIDNSSFKILGIFKSPNITVDSCDLTNLNLDHCSNSYFKNCSIENVGNLRSHGNVFEDCQITNKVRKTLQEGLFELPNLKYWPLVIITAGLAFASITYVSILYSVPFGLYWYLSIIIFIGVTILFSYLSRIQKKHIPNKIISNQKLK